MVDQDKLRHALCPAAKPRIIDLVAAAGFDVSDWSNYKGGQEKAGANPKYCYEWCYEQDGKYLLNIWYENMSFEADAVRQHLNLRNRTTDLKGVRRVRARRFDTAVRSAYEIGANPRVVVQHRPVRNVGGVESRLLDRSPWTVESYSFATGDMVLRRGIVPMKSLDEADEELAAFNEGALRQAFIRHRRRESRLRRQKIDWVLEHRGQKLCCEVEGCGFDFFEVYGDKGEGFAHVHHLRPLASFRDEGEKVTLDDLAVVCANCHAMIHRGGQCRPLRGLIAGRCADV